MNLISLVGGRLRANEICRSVGGCLQATNVMGIATNA